MVQTRCHAAANSGSQLLAAVLNDDLDAVQRELQRPAAAEWSSDAGVTALHLAAGFAGPAVLAALLAALPGAGNKQHIDAALEVDYSDPVVMHQLLQDASDETRVAFAGGATPLHVRLPAARCCLLDHCLCHAETC